jgi:predicted O-methyltransferase YrrM
MDSQMERRRREDDYNRTVFASEDEVLRGLAAAAQDEGLPQINISADVGRLLQILTLSIGARRALEIGALGGYSGIWIARGLQANGTLLTLELDEKHKAFAERWFARAGLAERVEVRLGAALESLAALPTDEPFDFIFIDAEKVEYPQYLEHAKRLLRPGGIITADNTFSNLAFPDDENAGNPVDRAIRAFNAALAEDSDYISIIIPIRAGVSVSLKKCEN